MGSSKWTTPSATKNEPGMEKELREMPEGHGMMSPPPRYVNDKAANMMFPSPALNAKSPSSSSPIQSRGPPVPPKEDGYQASPNPDRDRGQYGKGIRVQKEWDVERGFSEESDRQPLDPRRDHNSRW